MAKQHSTRNRPAQGVALTLVGLGNIGSHLASLLARIPGVGRLTLVDFDRYEPGNLRGQEIHKSEVGQLKARAQARRLQRINPALEVLPICARVEDVPLGLLRGDALLGALDSRVSRQYVNQAAWRLRMAWIDAAVDAAALLVRVNVYSPGPDAPCIECAWDDADYAALEQAYPCRRGAAGVPPTNAAADLGAIAAGLMATELQKLLAGDTEHLLAGRQVMLDLRHHTHDLTTFRRNPGCRFDHQTWPIEPLAVSPGRLTLGRLFKLAASPGSDSSGCTVQLEGHGFVRMLYCPGCGNHVRCPWRLARRIPAAWRQCVACGAELVARGFDTADSLESRALKPRERARSLASLGLRPGDVLTTSGPAGTRHFELTLGQQVRKGASHTAETAVET